MGGGGGGPGEGSVQRGAESREPSAALAGRLDTAGESAGTAAGGCHR